jgi:triphosphatase
MSVGSEIEVKLAVSDVRIFDQIAMHPEICALTMGPGTIAQSFEALYYDTPSFALQKSGLAYRVRHEGEQWVATVKSDQGSSGGFFSREEWNEPVDGPAPTLKPFAGTYVGDRLILAIGEESLQLLFSTRFVRTVLLLQTDTGSQIEMAMDKGNVWSGLNGAPICELELELKTGSVNDLMQLSGWVAVHWHLLPESKSKYARGLELISSNNTSIYFEVPPKDIVDPTPIALTTGCISEIFAAQKRLLTDPTNAEAVRELRIQMRRLRSILKIFQPSLSKESGRIHNDRLKQWGTLLGSIRDIDLLIAAWHKFITRFQPIVALSNYRLATLNDRRGFLAEEVAHRIGLGELTQHLFELQGWLYQERDLKSLEDAAPQSHIPLLKALLISLKELRGDIRAAAGTTEMKTLHRLRIQVKKIRYIQETLNEIVWLHDDEFTTALKKLQTHLGKIHDNYQIKSLLDQFDTGNIDEKLLLEKELFISWRSRSSTDYLSSLPKAVEEFRRNTKKRLRALAALRTKHRTKSGHHACSHEPSE